MIQFVQRCHNIVIAYNDLNGHLNDSILWRLVLILFAWWCTLYNYLILWVRTINAPRIPLHQQSIVFSSMVLVHFPVLKSQVKFHLVCFAVWLGSRFTSFTWRFRLSVTFCDLRIQLLLVGLFSNEYIFTFVEPYWHRCVHQYQLIQSYY